MPQARLFAGKPAPLIMGVINITPDSFSGDGIMCAEDAAHKAQALAADGADILDIGGESSRPGATPVSTDAELARVVPAIKAIRAVTQLPLSIDTTKAVVAEAALQAGADIVNDISGLQHDLAMADVVRKHNAFAVLMHNRAHGGFVNDSHAAPAYDDFLEDVMLELKKLAAHARGAGVHESRIILDPGLGFGKTDAQNLALINHCDRIAALGFPVLIGASRKSFIGHTLGLPVNDRLEGDMAACAIAAARGARVLRVHDVKAAARVVKMTAAILEA